MGRTLNEEDYIGKKYNHLTVIRKTDEKQNGVYLWEFRCDCGNFCKKRLTFVKNGNTKSCGCMKSKGLIEYNNKNRSIKIGDVFGKLTVLEEAGLRPYSQGHNRMWYKCKCECGNIVEKCGNQLKQGQTKSCGCLISQGEEEIEKLLKENHIDYEKEYVDHRLLNEYGRRLRFDFAIFKQGVLSYFIEFNGRQHTEGFDPGVFSNAEPVEKIQERDKIKIEFCKKYEIPLIIIDYKRLGKISLNEITLGGGA